MSELEKVLETVKKNDLPFYIERNDFMNGKLHITEELNDLIRDGHIDGTENYDCLMQRSVWSARFYFIPGHEPIVVYASTFDGVVKKIKKLLMETFNEN